MKAYYILLSKNLNKPVHDCNFVLELCYLCNDAKNCQVCTGLFEMIVGV